MCINRKYFVYYLHDGNRAEENCMLLGGGISSINKKLTNDTFHKVHIVFNLSSSRYLLPSVIVG